MMLTALTPDDLPRIDALLDAAFGPGRHARTAAKLRAGVEMLPALSFAARGAHGELMGSVQCWPVHLFDRARIFDAVLLGPLAVAGDARGQGVGSALVRAATEAAGDAPMLLVGDEPFYGRFGFSAALTGGWTLPSPVERHRLLARHAAHLPWRARVAPAVALRRAA